MDGFLYIFHDTIKKILTFAADFVKSNRLLN